MPFFNSQLEDEGVSVPQTGVFGQQPVAQQNPVEEAAGFISRLQPENQAALVAGLQLLRGEDIGTAGLAGLQAGQALKQQNANNDARQKQIGINQANSRTSQLNAAVNAQRVAAGPRPSEFERGLDLFSPQEQLNLRRSRTERLANGQPPSTVNVNTGGKGRTELEKQVGAQLSEELQAGLAANETVALTDLASRFTDDAFEGSLAGVQLEAVRLAKSVGVSDELLSKFNLDDAASSSEFFEAITNQLTLDRRSGVRDPQLNKQENEILQRAGPQLSQTAEGRKLILKLVKAQAAKKALIADSILDIGSREPNPFQIQKLVREVDRQNPTFPPELIEEIDQVIQAEQSKPVSKVGTTEVINFNGKEVKVTRKK